MDFDGFCSLIMDNYGNYEHENPMIKKKNVIWIIRFRNELKNGTHK